MNFTQITIDVENMDKTLRKIAESGGTVILPRTALEDDHGFYACFRDPNGNYLQVHSRR
jgi:predicted enzyme related to lactoylglutathione lyase